MFSFVANNQFAGNYTSTGFLFHPSAPRAIDADYAVTTVDLITNQFPVGDLGGSNYYFNAVTPGAGGALTNYQAAGATPGTTGSGFFTVDAPEGGAYASAAPNAPGTAPWLQTTYNNTYDAANKTYWLHYGYNGGVNAWTRQIYEKMVKDQ
jgi:hypothetical protein